MLLNMFATNRKDFETGVTSQKYGCDNFQLNIADMASPRKSDNIREKYVKRTSLKHNETEFFCKKLVSDFSFAVSQKPVIVWDDSSDEDELGSDRVKQSNEANAISENVCSIKMIRERSTANDVIALFLNHCNQSDLNFSFHDKTLDGNMFENSCASKIFGVSGENTHVSSIPSIERRSENVDVEYFQTQQCVRSNSPVFSQRIEASYSPSSHSSVSGLVELHENSKLFGLKNNKQYCAESSCEEYACSVRKKLKKVRDYEFSTRLHKLNCRLKAASSFRKYGLQKESRIEIFVDSVLELVSHFVIRGRNSKDKSSVLLDSNHRYTTVLFSSVHSTGPPIAAGQNLTIHSPRQYLPSCADVIMCSYYCCSVDILVDFSYTSPFMPRSQLETFHVAHWVCPYVCGFTDACCFEVEKTVAKTCQH
jgi:hypothetical protein